MYSIAPTVSISGGTPTVSTVATANIPNGSVSSITISNGGTGYQSVPIVTFSAPSGGGITATGVATVVGGVVTAIWERGREGGREGERETERERERERARERGGGGVGGGRERGREGDREREL
jgi:hypothetical protein